MEIGACPGERLRHRRRPVCSKTAVATLSSTDAKSRLGSRLRGGVARSEQTETSAAPFRSLIRWNPRTGPVSSKSVPGAAAKSVTVLVMELALLRTPFQAAFEECILITLALDTRRTLSLRSHREHETRGADCLQIALWDYGDAESELSLRRTAELPREFIRDRNHNMDSTNLSITAGATPTTPSGAAPSPETVVDATIEEHRSNPIDLLNLNDAAGELKYLRMLQSSYERTVRDLTFHFAATPRKEEIHVFELGAYLGVVSVSLRKLGFKVTATDLPEFVSNPRLQRRYASFGIELVGANLRHYNLAFPDQYFDVVVMC